MAKNDNIKVKFTQSREVLDADRNVEQAFEAGKTYELNPASAQRWVRRGVATYVSTSNARTDTDNGTNN